MVECLATAKSTNMMIQELPERLNMNPARMEHQAVSLNHVDMISTIEKSKKNEHSLQPSQADQTKLPRPAMGLSLDTAKVEYPASTPSLVDITTTIRTVHEMPRKKEHSLQPSQAELTRIKLANQRREKRLQRMSSSRNLAQCPGPQRPRTCCLA